MFRLFRLYQHVHHRSAPYKIYFHTGQYETVYAADIEGYQIYATFGPLDSKQNIHRAFTMILRWIRAEEPNLFMLNTIFGPI
jgi:hypothetical protein